MVNERESFVNPFLTAKTKAQINWQFIVKAFANNLQTRVQKTSTEETFLSLKLQNNTRKQRLNNEGIYSHKN